MSKSSKKKQNRTKEPAKTEAAVQVKQPGKFKSAILKEKSTIIVLVICAVIFIAALCWIHSEEIFKNNENDMFSPYGKEEVVDFEKGTVIAIQQEEKEADEVAEGAYVGSQELLVKVKSGYYKGQEMVAYNYFGPLYGVPVAVGDGVVLTIKTHSDGQFSATVYEFNRIPIMAIFLAIFFIIVVVIGRLTGLKSLIGLIFTFVCLFAILIPLLLKGAPTIIMTVLTCTFIALVSFTILGGVHRKTISAFLGTIAGVLLAMVFAIVIQSIAKIDGLRLEDAEPLLQLDYAGMTIKLKGLLVAGVIISSLGAVMDVAMSISSALEEVHAANPALTRKDLFKSGMNIGRDMVGTMTNTLILAFLGCEFTLMIFFFARELTFYHLTATVFITLETISGVCASIGMVLSIPLTAFISSTLITNKKLADKKHVQ